MKSVKDIVSHLRLIGEESTDDEAVAEVIMVSTVATRLGVTNRAVISMLRDKANPDLDWYREAVRAELAELAEEKTRDADWLKAEIKIAAGRPGRARDSQDFRSVDVKPLKRRRNVLLAVVDRLAQLANDDTYVTTEATECRDRTRAEVKVAIQEIASRGVHPDPYLTDEERTKRIGDLGRDLMSEFSQLAKVHKQANTQATKQDTKRAEKADKAEKKAAKAKPST